MHNTVTEKMYLLPFDSSSTRTRYLALVTDNHLQDIRLYCGIDINISLGPSDQILVDIGMVEVYELRHVVSPYVYRHLSKLEPKELVHAPALAIPDNRQLNRYLHVAAPDAPLPMKLQLVRSATATWLQLVNENVNTVLATRGVDVQTIELPEPEQEAQELLLIIYNQTDVTKQQADTLDPLVLAIPVSELQRDIRMVAPLKRDRDVILERLLNTTQKFWLSDILLGGETKSFTNSVRHEFQSNPEKRYTIRRVRSACIASHTQEVPVAITYRVPVGRDAAIPVSIRIPGGIQIPITEPLEPNDWQNAA